MPRVCEGTAATRPLPGGARSVLGSSVAALGLGLPCCPPPQVAGFAFFGAVKSLQYKVCSANPPFFQPSPEDRHHRVAPSTPCAGAFFVVGAQCSVLVALYGVPRRAPCCLLCSVVAPPCSLCLLPKPPLYSSSQTKRQSRNRTRVLRWWSCWLALLYIIPPPPCHSQRDTALYSHQTLFLSTPSTPVLPPFPALCAAVHITTE